MKIIILAFILPMLVNKFEVNTAEYALEWNYDNYNIYTEDEIELMARVVMSEASTLSLDGKQAVAEVIINRVKSKNYPDTITDVINQPKQFYKGDNGEPTEDCYTAIRNAVCDKKFPDDMYWFRLKKVTYGYEYIKIGNTYFSTEKNYKE